MIVEIEKKLQKMDKSEIFQICRKMKCPMGTKKEMIGSLLRPLGKKYKMKYKMNDKKILLPPEIMEHVAGMGNRQAAGRLATANKANRE